MKRGHVTDRLNTVSCGDLEGPVDEAIKFLNLQTLRYKGYTDLKLSYDDYEYQYIIYGTRLETDKEFAARERRSQRAKEANMTKQKKKEAQELAELARLKKKYEKASSSRA